MCLLRAKLLTRALEQGFPSFAIAGTQYQNLNSEYDCGAPQAECFWADRVSPLTDAVSFQFQNNVSYATPEARKDMYRFLIL